MPARRKRLASYKKKKKRKKNLITPLLILSTLAALFGIIFFSSRFWDGRSKLSVAIRGADGDVVVSTFLPDQSEIINITIPKETEVELSRQLGKVRIKNAWQVGLNEGHDGKVLAETITRHFKFPVAAWADWPAEGFTQSNLSLLIKAAFSPYKTNLTIGDRVRLAVFAASIKNVKRENISLAETTYLRKTQLIDGREGYVVTGRFPQKLLVIFSDDAISRAESTVVIIDETGEIDSSNELGKLIEVLGAKVASIEKKDKQSYDCKVSGREGSAVERVALLLSCQKLKDSSPSNFDIRVSIGEEFAQRF